MRACMCVRVYIHAVDFNNERTALAEIIFPLNESVIVIKINDEERG